MADITEPIKLTWHEKPVRFVRDAIGFLIPVVRGSFSGDQLIWRQEIILLEKMGQ